MNWATQIAARVVKTAASVISWEVPLVVQPPHAKPMIIAMTAPRIRPQTPYLTFTSVSGFIDITSSSNDTNLFFRFSHRELKILARNPSPARFRDPKEHSGRDGSAPSAIWTGQYPITTCYVNLSLV